eukprot:TRINITY_DN25089_c0_g1_i1.p1 TRINITY_DN25089_c0_g1~~TRINITY_DN25089_c0_g1_i1.p1  ORF type:complete len:470 (+),score=54.60 TRINITY_DN25089_c0_g1_i1:40-1449(+)
MKAVSTNAFRTAVRRSTAISRSCLPLNVQLPFSRSVASTSKEGKRILISGAGVAGLTCAQTLKRMGFNLTIVDNAPDERTAYESQGLLLHPNATGVLHQLGFGKQLEKYGQIIKYYSHAHALDGKNITDTAILSEKATSYGQPDAIGIAKADLIKILGSGLNIRRRSGVTSLEQEDALQGKKINVQLKGAFVKEVFDIVIGADGPNSQIRDLLFPEMKQNLEVTKKFFETWQIILPKGSKIRSDHAFELWGEGHRMFVVPISENEVFTWTTSEIQNVSHMLKEGLVPIGGFVGSRIPEFYQWKGYGVQDVVTELKRLTMNPTSAAKSKIYRTVPFEVKLPSWSSGNVVLIGDAAHASYPNIMQGAGMAIEDGFSLAKWLSHPDVTIEKAFQSYFEERSPRITKFQKETNWYNNRGEKRYLPFQMFQVALRRKWLNGKISRHHHDIPEYFRYKFFYKHYPWKDFPQHKPL